MKRKTDTKWLKQARKIVNISRAAAKSCGGQSHHHIKLIELFLEVVDDLYYYRDASSDATNPKTYLGRQVDELVLCLREFE